MKFTPLKLWPISLTEPSASNGALGLPASIAGDEANKSKLLFAASTNKGSVFSSTLFTLQKFIESELWVKLLTVSSLNI